jgi:hypothetical protein
MLWSRPWNCSTIAIVFGEAAGAEKDFVETLGVSRRAGPSTRSEWLTFGVEKRPRFRNGSRSGHGLR